MNNRDDGGPAFPLIEEGPHSIVGMSLRDYLAAHAVNGIIGAYDLTKAKPRTIARAAYGLADEMLIVRKESP